MSHSNSIKTQGFVTFGQCADPELTLFRVNADVPLQQALEQASTLLYYAKKLALDAAMEGQGERYAWAAYFLRRWGRRWLMMCVWGWVEERLREGSELEQHCTQEIETPLIWRLISGVSNYLKGYFRPKTTIRVAHSYAGRA